MDPLGGSGFGEMLQSLVDFFISFGIDFFAFLVVAGVIAGFAFYFGKDRLLSLIAAIYAATLLYQAFPYMHMLPAPTPLIEIGLFVAFVIVCWLALSGMSYFLPSSNSTLFSTLLLSAATAGLILALSIHVLPVQELYTFSEPTLALFASAEAFFLWLAAPLAAVFFFGK